MKAMEAIKENERGSFEMQRYIHCKHNLFKCIFFLYLLKREDWVVAEHKVDLQ
jgi:hypothetical protein